MNNLNIFERARFEISNDKNWDKTFQLLIDYAKNFNNNIHDELILLKYQYKSTNRRAGLNLISREVLNLEESRIIYRIVEIIRELESGNSVPIKTEVSIKYPIKILIDDDIENFDKTREKNLINITAALLNLDKSNIEILRITRGSVSIILLLPHNLIDYLNSLLNEQNPLFVSHFQLRSATPVPAYEQIIKPEESFFIIQKLKDVDEIRAYSLSTNWERFLGRDRSNKLRKLLENNIRIYLILVIDESKILNKSYSAKAKRGLNFYSSISNQYSNFVVKVLFDKEYRKNARRKQTFFHLSSEDEEIMFHSKGFRDEALMRIYKPDRFEDTTIPLIKDYYLNLDYWETINYKINSDEYTPEQKKFLNQ